MGVHHYYLKVITKSFADKHKSDLAEVLEEQSPWEDEIPSAQFLECLRKLLPNDTSWGNVEEFDSGADFSSDIRIWKKGSKVEDIDFRFSPGTEGIELLECFVTAVAKENCLLFSRESKALLEPVLEVILEDLKSSRAYRFISDPKEVILEAAETIKYNSEKDDIVE